MARKKLTSKDTTKSSRPRRQKSKTSKKQQSKNISLKEVVDKVIKVVKKPFKADSSKLKTKTSRPKRQRKEQIFVDDQQPSIIPVENINDVVDGAVQPQVGDVPFAESKSTTQVSNFFCTSDAFFDTMDDQDLYKFLRIQFKELDENVVDEQAKRRAIIDMLENEQFINDMLEHYNMDICDFLKFLFRLCPSVFKGMFIKKVQKSIEGKKYAESINFGKYTKGIIKKSVKRSSIF